MSTPVLRSNSVGAVLEAFRRHFAQPLAGTFRRESSTKAPVAAAIYDSRCIDRPYVLSMRYLERVLESRDYLKMRKGPSLLQ